MATKGARQIAEMGYEEEELPSPGKNLEIFFGILVNFGWICVVMSVMFDVFFLDSRYSSGPFGFVFTCCFLFFYVIL